MGQRSEALLPLTSSQMSLTHKIYDIHDKKEKESHILKGLIEELIADPSEVFEDLPLAENEDEYP
ncbi:hypothetical protein Glove_193g64 [Diversispora epigaea]|uniref:Uncharacterized protein n=1 Tax=Diversispora epigaea TaxID=1348612 RepID=A0A397IUG5_9GLOM|nr:hypothetical protein Glove_193g64 [Diversispora epigaea]